MNDMRIGVLLKLLMLAIVRAMLGETCFDRWAERIEASKRCRLPDGEQAPTRTFGWECRCCGSTIWATLPMTPECSAFDEINEIACPECGTLHVAAWRILPSGHMEQVGADEYRQVDDDLFVIQRTSLAELRDQSIWLPPWREETCHSGCGS